MKYFSQIKTYKDDRFLKSGLILFFIWPFRVLLFSLKHYRNPSAKKLFWFFCIYFGFVFIIGTFFIAAVWVIRKRQSLALGFLALSAISFLTESMLERQAGVLLFSFFFGLFFVNRLKGNKAKTGQIVKN